MRRFDPCKVCLNGTEDIQRWRLECRTVIVMIRLGLRQKADKPLTGNRLHMFHA